MLLNPPTATLANVPMVILDRHGQLLSARSQAAGPVASSHPAWSPNGRLLAYPTYASTGPALAIQSLEAQPGIYQVSNPNTQLGNCVWAPTDVTVVCLARAGVQTAWDFANTATRTLSTGKSLGFPIVWLPPPGANPQESLQGLTPNADADLARGRAAGPRCSSWSNNAPRFDTQGEHWVAPVDLGAKCWYCRLRVECLQMGGTARRSAGLRY